MKKTGIFAILAAGIFTTTAKADERVFVPESHAPAGVMSEHMHHAGEVMTGYRYQRSSYKGLYQGSRKISVDDLAAAGFGMMSTSMEMEMMMLDLMYAPTDRLTFMLMPMYMLMDMDMAATGAEMGHGHGGHGGHEVAHSHGVSGFGDTNLSAIFRLAAQEHYQVIGSLGVWAPTGKANLKNADGTYVHYGMQLGSKTWDLAPSITYTGLSGQLSWGAQASALIRLESENNSGFAFGDKYQATFWGAYRLLDSASLSVRLAWENQDAISGHYNGPHHHNAPEDFQENYGGEFIDAGLGLNFVVRDNRLAGLRLGAEWVTRIDEKYNGYQLGMNNAFHLSISYAFR